MKYMKIHFIIAMLCFSLIVHSAQSNTRQVGSMLESKSSKTPKWLFVISAKEATVSPLKNGTYLLKINLSSLNQAVMFSDRPNRLVKTLDADHLNSLWTQGKNSFADDSPNAVLSAIGKPLVVMTISDIKVTDGIISIYFVKTSGEALSKDYYNLSNLTLTIDSLEINEIDIRMR